MRYLLSLLLFLDSVLGLGTEPVRQCVCAKADQPTFPDTLLPAQSSQLVQAVNGVCPVNTYPVTNSLAQI